MSQLLRSTVITFLYPLRFMPLPFLTSTAGVVLFPAAVEFDSSKSGRSVVGLFSALEVWLVGAAMTKLGNKVCQRRKAKAMSAPPILFTYEAL